jgi:hypothetical protein
MRPAIVGLLLLSACSDSTGSSTSNPDAYVGTWHLAVGQSNCGGPFDVTFTVDQHDADVAPSEFINVVSDWWFTENPTVMLPFSGNINWTTPSFDLRLTKSFPVQGHFTGSSVSPSKLTGTFSDPGGDFWISAQGGPCSASAEATK